MAGHAAADWKGDEAYIRRLRAQVQQLKQSLDLFGRHLRALELVEADVANVQLGLADPRSKPDVLVHRLMRSAYPDVKITMDRRRAVARRGVEVWVWRCRLQGALGELRWATQLLRHKGLFILPTAAQPVRLLPDRDQRSGALVFHGHHVRIKAPPFRRSNRTPMYDQRLLSSRTDPLAAKIRQLQAEVARLQERLAAVRGFEGRIGSIRSYLALLGRLTRGSQDPFRAITPLLDLELVRYDRIQHEGQRVVVRGAVPSRSAREATLRWLRRLSRRTRLRIDGAALRLQYNPAATVALPVPDDLRGGGVPCRLVSAAAGALEVGLAAAPRALAIFHTPDRGAPRAASGRIARTPCQRALAAIARRVGLELLQDDVDVLLVPRAAGPRARSALRTRYNPRNKAKLPRNKAKLRLAAHRQPLGAILARLAHHLPGKLLAPQEATTSKPRVTLVGTAPVHVWLRLVGAGMGMALTGDRAGATVRLGPAGPAETSKPVPAARQRLPAASPALQDLGLAQLRPSLLVLRGRRSVAVLTTPNGTAAVVRRGARIGRNRSRVENITTRGLTLGWVGSGMSARVLLPPGEPRTETPPGLPAKPPAGDGKGARRRH